MTGQDSRYFVSQPRCPWLGWSRFAGVFLVVACGSCCGYAADYSTPEKTFQTFLQAVKANDLAAAKQCWFISDNDAAGVLDVLVGKWITARRLRAAAQSQLPASEISLLEEEGVLSESCTDEAIDRTLGRLSHAEVEVRGDSAKLR